MVNNMLFKTMIRDFKEHKMQFISIFLMAFLAIVAFSGIGAEVAGVSQSLTSFYDDTNFADVWIYSDHLDNNTLEKINNISSTTQTERQLTIPTVADMDDDPSITLHVIEKNTISKYYPVDGEDINLDDKDSIWLDKRFTDARGLKIGDKIKLKSNNITIEKTIKGTGYSPEYVYSQSSKSIVPDFNLHGFAYMSNKAFPIDDVPYNVVLIKTSDNTSTYQEKIDENIRANYTTYLPRKDQSSHVQINSEIEQHEMMGNMMPVIFIVVSLLTLLTTMTRMVNHQRTQIGTLKALGFTNKRLYIHYASYGFMLTTLGCILALIIAPRTIPSMFFPSMSSFYTLPQWKSGFNITFIIVSLLLILVSTLFSYIATRNIVSQSPSSTLQPQAPKFSSRSLLDRTTLFERLGFNSRWNIRDIKRNKLRSLVVIVCVMGCTILLISAFGMDDGMHDLSTWQYGGINNYNSQIVLEENITSSQLDKITSSVNGLEVMSKPIEIKVNDTKKTVNLNVYNKSDYITPTDTHMKKINLPSDGVSLTVKTADILGVKKGDNIEWHLYGDDKWVNTTVDEIYADPANQGITITPSKLEDLGFNFTPTMIVTDMKVNDSYDGASSVNTMDDLLNSWNELMDNAILLVAVFLILAVCISVVMLYSLGILAFCEVERDLATLKVLGFDSKSIRRLFLTQNLWLSIVGFLLGIPLGYQVLRVMMDTAGETFYYPINYSLKTIALSFVITIVLSFVVNFLISRNINDVDMVESLKKQRE